MNSLSLAFVALASTLAATSASAEGDVARGADLYRACVACHSLEEGVHLTGPSLAGLWQRPAGTVAGFVRYSETLRGAGFPWDAAALDAWLADPRQMIAGTTMTFRGIPDAAARADLIAFLETASDPGDLARLVASEVLPPYFVRGQAPEPLRDAPDHARVTAVRHCGDGYTIKTADGARSIHWEKNVRLKIDSAETGPPPGSGVILASGMQGDRVSVVFASLVDLRDLVTESCAPGEGDGRKP